MTCRLVAVAALAMLASGVLTAGPSLGPAVTPAGPADAATPDTIHVDAIVTDRKDRPILDLKASDFEIRDNGESRAIESATLESGRDGRFVAIFLDDYHVQAGANTVRARSALAEFVKSELRPNDLVAVMKPLDSLKAIQITQDRDALRSAIETFEGRKGDYTPRTPFEQGFMSRAPASADASRAQVVASALQALAQRIGNAREGRKTIVLVSEGFTPTLPRGTGRWTGSLRAVVFAANRYGVAVYPIDPRISADDSDSDHVATSALQTLANETGGTATINRDDLTAGMRQAVRDLDSYYELTYRAAAAGDGQFHPVQVRVKRPDAQVRMRSGYWAANLELLQLAAGAGPRATTTAFRASHASPLIRQWVGMSRGPDDLTSLLIAWEPGVAPPRNQHVGSVVLKATTDAGRVLFQDRVESRATFNAPPGHVQLEMIIQGVDGTTLDSDYRWIDVSNLHVARSTIATPQLMRTRSAREFAAESASLDVTPAASREFSRAERLLLRVPVYSADDSVPTVTARLLNRMGTPMRSLSQVPAALPAGLVQFDLPLSSFAPDDYRVEIAAKSADGQEAKTVILFRITD